MPTLEETRYVFTRSERHIFTEIYFPKRVAYQGAIFNALRFGYDENEVKTYLHRNVSKLLTEFSIYPALFDPHEYIAIRRRLTAPSIDEAHQRIDMYQSPFKGWSVYTVDGVFFGADGKMYEEATQVVRLMFRFKSSFTTQSTDAQCEDVLRSIIFWAISQQGRLNEHKPWSVAEKAQFIARHKPWPKRKLAFAKRYFTDVAKEVDKWVDDRALFIFGYLVRRFSENVLVEHLYEEEIWVTSHFDPLLNVIRRVEQPPQT